MPIHKQVHHKHLQLGVVVHLTLSFLGSPRTLASPLRPTALAPVGLVRS